MVDKQQAQTPVQAATDGLMVLEGCAEDRDPEAAAFLAGAGLPMSSLVMGLFDQSDDCIKLIDTDGALQLMNCNGRRAMEVDDFSVLAGAQWADLWPEKSRNTVAEAVAEARVGRTVRFEAFCPTAKGSPRWWEVTVSPVLRAEGGVAAILSSSRDISERRQRELALETISMEMRHRLRNAFAVSAAIVTASARGSPEYGEFAHEVAQRLVHLAEAQASLLDLGGGIPLPKLAMKVLNAQDPANGGLTLGDLPDIVLGENSARALALVLGELATNSIKYGALGRGGRTVLTAAVEAEGLALQWVETLAQDAPRSPADAVASSGQGGVIMERMLAAVGGTLSGGPNPDGFAATITLQDWSR